MSMKNHWVTGPTSAIRRSLVEYYFNKVYKAHEGNVLGDDPCDGVDDDNSIVTSLPARPGWDDMRLAKVARLAVEAFKVPIPSVLSNHVWTFEELWKETAKNGRSKELEAISRIVFGKHGRKSIRRLRRL